MKRKVVLYISQSLDGFIADSKGNVDWILGNNENYDSDYGYENFIKDIDTVILGSGIRLFEENNKKIRLELKDTKEENGLIIGIYTKR